MNNMQEEWRDIKGYEGRYKVSNLGRVKSLERVDNRGVNVHEKILSNVYNGHGYLTVKLSKNNKQKMFKLHRLVAQAFIPNPNNYPCVNHKDEVRDNNIYTNLEWCTIKYNNTYGTKIERYKNNPNIIKMVEASRKTVYQYTLDGKLIRTWESTNEAKYICGFDGCHISACCNGKRKSHKGFRWSYEPLIEV